MSALSFQLRHSLFAVLLAAGVAGCGSDAPIGGAANEQNSELKPTAGIKDIMAHMIDPAADALWESVSVEQTDKGEVHRQPRTDDEWRAVRGHAVTLLESANLLLMDGRTVAMVGHILEDHGTPGNLTAEESQAAIDQDRATFVSFAHALHDVGVQMMNATDAKNPQALMELGDSLDRVCEGCHLKFWYPGQKVPRFPDQAPEVDVTPGSK